MSAGGANQPKTLAVYTKQAAMGDGDAGSSISFASTGSSGYGLISFYAIQGGGGVDASASAIATTAGVNLPSLTLTQADMLIGYVGAGSTGGTPTITVPGDMNSRQNTSHPNFSWRCVLADHLLPSTAFPTETFGVSSTQDAGAIQISIAFKGTSYSDSYLWGPKVAGAWPGSGVKLGTPVPVVNGQWIKGVGGAAVWQPIAQSDLPDNLDGSQTDPPIGLRDCNSLTATGWYWLNSALPISNCPPVSGGYFQMQVLNGGNNIRQIAYEYNTTIRWERRYDGGSWKSWLRVYGPAYIGFVQASGAISLGAGFTVAHPSAGNYTITLATSLFQPVPMVTPTGQSVVGGIAAASGTVLLVYMTTPSAWIDSAFQFCCFDAT
jgi:hypothetical protein